MPVTEREPLTSGEVARLARDGEGASHFGRGGCRMADGEGVKALKQRKKAKDLAFAFFDYATRRGVYWNSYTSGFIVGKSNTSLIDALSVRSITSLSIPKPRPPVGGIPYSSAVT